MSRTRINPPSTETVNATPVGSEWTGGTITATRKGNCCFVKLNGVAHGALTQRTVIANLPEGFRPPSETYFFIRLAANNMVVAYVAANGDVSIAAIPAGTHYACVSYPV